MDINKLLHPKSMAVIGVSDKPGFGRNVAKSSVRSSIADRVYYVNPKRDELFDRKCYHSLEELPETVDLILLCTPAATVADYIDKAGQLGIGAAIVFASGFSEERSEKAQQMAKDVEAAAKRHDIALCGPNCVGFVSAVENICASPKDNGMLGNGVERGIGVVAQSGYITNGFLLPDSKRLAYVISAGNCTMCSIEDYMLFLAENEHVNCVAAYIEGIRKPKVLVQALKAARDRNKPVVVLKAGMTEKGSFAAQSHTGSMAGDYKTFESICRKFGVVLTSSLQEFSTTARMFSVLDGNFPKCSGIGAINFSGGENTLCADTCDRLGLELPPYSEQTRDAIKKLLPSYSTASNPLDATTTMFSEKEKVRALFEAVSEDPSYGLIVLGNDVGVKSENKDITCAEIMPQLKQEGRLLPSVVIPSTEQPRNPEILETFEKAGIPVLSTGLFAYMAVRHLMDYAACCSEERTMELAFPEYYSKERISLSEAQSKEEIAAFGVRVPKQARASSPESLEQILDQMEFPVVLKIDSPDIQHKTDAGGVKVGIRGKEEAQTAYEEILRSCKAYDPSARIDGVLVQEMVQQGTELIIGIKNDRQFGPMLLAGMGGIFTELFQDAALYPCPISKEEALRMLKSLHSYKLLTGYRGSAPCDVDAVTDLMVRISEYAVEKRNEIAEVDLNPVFVYGEGKGAVAVDALIIKYGQEEV